MKKLENFSWEMWHILSLVVVTVMLVGGAWSFFYSKEVAYLVHERNYKYVGRGQRLITLQLKGRMMNSQLWHSRLRKRKIGIVLTMR